MDPSLKQYLGKFNIKYKEHKHPAVFTVEESKKIDKGIPGLHTKNLFLYDDNENFYLVCLPADKRLNIKLLKQILNSRDLHFGSPEMLKAHLNITPGSVSLFNMIYAKDVELVIDKAVWDAEITGFHPNENTSTLEITKESLEKFYNSLRGKKRIVHLG